MQENIQTQPTPVFDFTATINAALAQAIQIHTAPLVERINNLQNSATTDIANLTKRIALLEEVVKNVPDEDRIKEIADEVARDVMSEHVGDYDHDEYDRLEDKIEEKVSDAIDDYDFEDKINDALRSATITISV